MVTKDTIKNIEVLVREREVDRVYIHTTLPSPYTCYAETENLTVSFEVSKGHGAEYVRTHFDIEPTVLEV